MAARIVGGWEIGRWKMDRFQEWERTEGELGGDLNRQAAPTCLACCGVAGWGGAAE